jgi:hypothetical protein
VEAIFIKLEELRAHPETYLKEKSLTLLKMFISGYITKEWEVDKTSYTLFDGFDEFVRQKFEIKSTHGWLKILLLHSSSEEDALNLFYHMLDEYKLTVFPPKAQTKI